MAQVYAYYFDKEIFFKYLKFIVVVNYLNFCYYKIEIKMKHKKNEKLLYSACNLFFYKINYF